MKLGQHANTLETNTKVKSRDFRIGNASKIIGILRNYLYGHKIRTPVQEYISNARDAMREAKSTKRIVVTVPNQLNPVFKVRDFGPGITPERMEDVFLAYGESTKEGTNNEAGGFGIGAKSAWAYTDSFTIVSITGGRKRTYVAHTGVNNQGRLDEISDEATTEATGAEIHIAVKSGDIEQFRNAIWRACHFWKDSEYPEFKGVVAQEVPTRKPTTRLGDLELATGLPAYLGLESSYYGDYCSIVIDGIPYKMDKAFIGRVEKLSEFLKGIKCDVLIHVGNGVLDIPASRESVSTEDVNKELLNKMAPKLQEALGKHVKSEFAKAKTYAEWVTTYNTMSKIMNVDQYSKRGEYFINGGDIGSKLFKDFSLFEVGRNYGRRGNGTKLKRSTTSSIRLDQLDNVYFVDVLDEAMVTQNRRVDEYLTKSNRRSIILMFPAEQSIMEVPPGTRNILQANMTPLAVKKITATFAQSEKAMKQVLKDLGGKPLSTLPYTPIVRVPRAKRDRTKEDFTIHNHWYGRKRPDTTTLEKVEISDDKYLYVAFKDHAKYKQEFSNMREFAEKLGFTLCYLTPKSISLVKNSSSFKHYDKWLAAYKPDAKLLAQCCYNKAKNIAHMNMLKKAATKIEDAALVEMLAIYEPILKIDSVDRDMPIKIEALVSDQVKDFVKSDTELTRLLKDSYPLVGKVADLDRIDAATANELVLYINAKA